MSFTMKKLNKFQINFRILGKPDRKALSRFAIALISGAIEFHNFIAFKKKKNLDDLKYS